MNSMNSVQNPRRYTAAAFSSPMRHQTRIILKVIRDIIPSTKRVATDSAILSVGFSLDPKRSVDYVRDNGASRGYLKGGEGCQVPFS